MTNPITNSEDIIDSRDIIERIKPIERVVISLTVNQARALSDSLLRLSGDTPKASERDTDIALTLARLCSVRREKRAKERRWLSSAINYKRAVERLP